MPDRQGPEREFPEWLKTIAVRVDELVTQPPVMERFRWMLRQWADEQGQSDSPVFDLPPVRAMTLAEKYAAISAIHDHVCQDAKRIDPWGIRRKTKNLAKLKAGIPYTVLVDHRASQITDEHCKRLEAVLTDVASDVENHVKTEASNECHALPARSSPSCLMVTDARNASTMANNDCVKAFHDLAYHFEDIAQRPHTKAWHFACDIDQRTIQAAKILERAVLLGLFADLLPILEFASRFWKHRNENERLLLLWATAIGPSWLSTIDPEAFRADGPELDYLHYKKRLGVKGIYEEVRDADGNIVTKTWRLPDEDIVCLEERYDTEDAVYRQRARAENYADACRLLAKLASERKAGASPGSSAPDKSEASCGSGDGRSPADDEHGSGLADSGATAVPLTGDEAVATINRMLKNEPEWYWNKHARLWLEKRSVRIYRRAEWRETFATPPPRRRGNLAIVDESDLMRAIRDELHVRNNAFDVMDSVEDLHRRSSGKP